MVMLGVLMAFGVFWIASVGPLLRHIDDDVAAQAAANAADGSAHVVTPVHSVPIRAQKELSSHSKGSPSTNLRPGEPVRDHLTHSPRTNQVVSKERPVFIHTFYNVQLAGAAIVVLAYNRPHHLEKTLKSLFEVYER